LAFDDLDPDTFPIDYENDPEADDFAPMTVSQAQEVAIFVRGHVHDSQAIVVHCRYGVSRSAGAAKAIAEYAGAVFPWGYDGYNAHVYRLVKEALALP
jgi:rhodanese-related sulfurtransferase